MSKSGKGLAALALIIGLLGAGFGGYMMIDRFVLSKDLDEDDDESYIFPKARVTCVDKPGYDLSSNAFHIINFTDANYDTHNAFNFDTDQYVIPETGFYQVTAQVAIQAHPDDSMAIWFYVNNTPYSVSVHTPAFFSAAFTLAICDVVNVTKGAYLDIRVYHSNFGNDDREVFDNEDYTFFLITKIP